jgi:hypothetical protein
MTFLVTELLSPSPIGPAGTRMSAAITCSYSVGQACGEAVLGHVGVDAGRPVVVDSPDLAGTQPPRVHDGAALVDQPLGVTELWRRFERAVDEQGGEVVEAVRAVGRAGEAAMAGSWGGGSAGGAGFGVRGSGFGGSVSPRRRYVPLRRTDLTAAAPTQLLPGLSGRGAWTTFGRSKADWF